MMKRNPDSKPKLKDYHQIDIFRSPYSMNLAKLSPEAPVTSPKPLGQPPRSYSTIEAFARFVKDFGLMRTQSGNGQQTYTSGDSGKNTLPSSTTHGGYSLLQGANDQDNENDNEVYGARGPVYSYSMGVGLRRETDEKPVKTDWVTFTEDTTFHGIKYIFQKSPIKLRRSVDFVYTVYIYIYIYIFFYSEYLFLKFDEITNIIIITIIIIIIIIIMVEHMSVQK